MRRRSSPFSLPSTVRQLRATIALPIPDLLPGEPLPAPLVITARTPSLPKASAVMNAIGLKGVRALSASAGAFATNGGPATLLGMVSVAGPSLTSGVGALIGVAWADPTFELDTPPPATLEGPELLRYGADVWEELETAGWDLSAILSLALPILREILDGMEVRKEVRELADFFVPRTEPKSSEQPS